MLPLYPPYCQDSALLKTQTDPIYLQSFVYVLGGAHTGDWAKVSTHTVDNFLTPSYIPGHFRVSFANWGWAVYQINREFENLGKIENNSVPYRFSKTFFFFFCLWIFLGDWKWVVRSDKWHAGCSINFCGFLLDCSVQPYYYRIKMVE